MAGFLLQMFHGVIVTLSMALCSAVLGICLGLISVLMSSTSHFFIRSCITSILFLIRSLPELLVLFFIYFGLTTLLSNLSNHYVDISPFVAGVIALSLIFGAYAANVFKGAFAAVDKGQLQASSALGFTRLQTFFTIHLPQAWRYALPGLGNLWLALLKDTSIVMLIGLADLLNAAKLAASATHQPFTYYLIAAGMYLMITSFSQTIIKCIVPHARLTLSP